MPAILTRPKNAISGCAPWDQAMALQKPLPNDALRIVIRGAEKGDKVAA